MLDWALHWASEGWPVFPLSGKVPVIPRLPKHNTEDGKRCVGQCGKLGHGVYDGTTDPDRVRAMWAKYPNADIGGSTAGRVVFDFDLQNGGGMAGGDALPATATHWSGRNNGNHHLIYRADPESVAAQIKSGTAVRGKGFDIKAGHGSYVVLPPSVHETTGKAYWADYLTPEIALPDRIALEYLTETKRGFRVVAGGEGRTLSSLLENPPNEGGRNDWLTTVCGYYAKQYRRAEDLYWVHVKQANRLLQQPLDDDEVLKTGQSIWDTEQGGHPERDATVENGSLIGNGVSLAVTTKIGNETGVGWFANFDLVCRGVALDDQSRRTYWVALQSADRTVETTVDGAVFGDPRAVSKWLAGFGLSVSEHPFAYPKMAPHVRLLRYLNGQNPPQVVVSEVLGWDPALNGFVVPDGLITADGLVARGDAGVCASPKVVAEASVVYGFEGTRAQAVDVLREVLTYQVDSVTSVFGSWWAATLAKEWITRHTSLFPFVAVEATSGSGKTNGFFNCMVQLNGSTRGEGTMTRAVTRTIASLNRNGIAWIDDMDHIDTVTEVLRAATSGGSMSKMDIDHRGPASIRLVSAVVVTGEHLGFTQEKALADRSIGIDAPSPINRMSVKPGRQNTPQWEDITALLDRFPAAHGGLAVISGWFLQIAAELHRDGTVDACIKAAKKDPARRKGRNGDKDLALLTGARLLEAILGEADEPRVQAVREWIRRQTVLYGLSDADNSLTIKILPRLLREVGFADHVSEGGIGDRFNYTPVMVRTVGRNAQETAKAWLESDKSSPGIVAADAVEVWFNVAETADCWSALHAGRINQRTESESSIRQQLSVLSTRRTSVAIGGRSGKRMNYRALTGDLAAAVVARALDMHTPDA